MPAKSFVVRIFSSSDHFITHTSANAGASNNSSISAARLSGSSEATNARVASAVGSEPARSMCSRRTNSASVQTSLGAIRSVASFASTSSSM